MVVLVYGPWGIPAVIAVGPLVVHAYGLVLGLAGIVGWLITSKYARKLDVSEMELQQYAVAAVVGGVLGARIWHVATDWWLYAGNWWQTLALWRGGLSIFGGMAGGVTGVFAWWIVGKRAGKRTALWPVLDCAALGLPFAQAIGRLANYVNYELYGLPTGKNWGIFIPLERRLPGFELVALYHPLFLYEAIALLIFGSVSWWCVARRPTLLGTGWVAVWYMLFYLSLRFVLDFWRIGVPEVLWGLSANQLICLAGVLVAAFLLVYRSGQHRIRRGRA